MNLVVGTYSKDTNSEGIYLLEADKGNLKLINSFENKNNPSWLTIIKEKNLLIANEELDDIVSFTTYKIEEDKLVKEMRHAYLDLGFGSCHSTFNDNKLYISNYGSGDCLILDENYDFADNQISYTSSFDAHCHETIVSSTHILIIDLGLDQIIVYTKDLVEIGRIQFNKGEGPRHALFSKDEKYFYVLTEMSNMLHTFDTEIGFKLISSISTLKEDFNKTSYGAEIVLNNNKIYVSNRGEDSIAVFTLENNIPKYEKTFSTFGNHPRSFCIEENIIYIANKDSNNIVAIDKETGEKLSDLSIPTPTFIVSI